MSEREILNVVLANTGESISIPVSPQETVDDLNERIKQLTNIKSGIIVLFGYVDLKRNQTLDLIFENRGNSAQLSMAVSQRRLAQSTRPAGGAPSSITTSVKRTASNESAIGGTGMIIDAISFRWRNGFVPKFSFENATWSNIPFYHI